MRFNKVLLDNMFSYKGNISFSFDNSDKPIFLIIGENGFGKTSFINSVKICLHGITKDVLSIGSTILSKKDFVLGNPLKNFSGILNRYAKLEGVNYCKVQLEVEDDELIKIERSFIIHKNSYIEKLVIYDNEDKIIATDDEAQDIINNKISPNIQSFFFFDGEKIQTIADFSHSEFKNMLEEVLDLKIYDQIVNDGNLLLKKIQKDELDEESAIKLNNLEKEYSHLTLQLEKLENELQLNQEKLKELNEEKRKLEKILTKSKNRFSKELKIKNEELKELKENLKKNINEFKQLIYIQLPILFNKELFKKVQKDIKDNYSDSININPDALAQKKNEFLSYLQKSIDNQYIEKIATIFDNVFSQKSKNISVLFANSEIIQTQFNNFANIDITQILSKISQLKSQIKKLEIEIYELERQAEANNKDLFDLQYKITNDLSISIGQQIEKITSINYEIEVKKREIKEVEKEIGKLSTKEFKNSLAIKKMEILDAISEIMNFIKSKIKHEKRSHLEKAINEKFKLLKKPDFEGDKIILDDEFHLNLIDKFGNPMEILSCSSGQKQVIATSLIWGISEFINQDIPMIIDTPLGRLDDKNQSLILEKFYPHVSNQVIILPTPSELKNPTFKKIKDYISQVYLLSNKGSATQVKSLSLEELDKTFTYQPTLELN